ncbi:uncharacterized protein LOC119683299 [Teleopsis dalmanni]|uniref:uncharacterized protein LOC119683299 n=1 Tax=Teleopsis dalmanni TaxID=139649 RepID=UPI0018CFE02F|nr:uncharacterized protein LOC119683299 [Teleopsis dalmanni]
MHQVLSYETAVRANSSREFREYVTKRTCVSLVLTIAFFTLISGYLLGNFVSERKYHLNKLLLKNAVPKDNQIELNSEDYTSLKEIHAYKKTKEMLLASAQAFTKKMIEDKGLSSSLNTLIFNKYISCTQDIPPNTTIESSQFIEELIDNTAARQRDCLRIIQVIIDNNMGNI